MKVKTDKQYKGARVSLDGDDLCKAIGLYLYSKGVYINGPRTIRINDGPTMGNKASIYVDPSGGCVYKGKQMVDKD